MIETFAIFGFISTAFLLCLAVSTGIIEGKEWLTQGDDRVRDTHFMCEKEGMIALADRFKTNDMLRPGDPAGSASEVCNCRCSLLYYDTLEQGASSIAGAGAAMAGV